MQLYGELNCKIPRKKFPEATAFASKLIVINKIAGRLGVAVQNKKCYFYCSFGGILAYLRTQKICKNCCTIEILIRL